MDGQKSRAALIEFLDYLARKGLMNKTTASARKAAVNIVLSILDDDEASDVSIIDLGDVMHRFSTLNGMNYTTDSLASYKSRVRSAIGDFLSYLENPMAFRPATGGANRKAQERVRATDSKSTRNVNQQRIQAPSPDFKPPPPVTSMVLPIPLRADLTVYIQGLPYDLTQAEASKLANVIRAMAPEG